MKRRNAPLFFLRLWVVGFLLPLNVFCQQRVIAPVNPDPSYQLFGREAGYPIQNIYDHHIDKEGWIWVIGVDGLFRFDGQRFEPVLDAVDHSKGPGLEITEDQHGTIWCAAQNFAITYVEDNTFLRYEFQDSVNKYFPGHTFIHSIGFIGDTLLLGTRDLGFFGFDENGNYFDPNPPRSEDAHRVLIIDTDYEKIVARLSANDKEAETIEFWSCPAPFSSHKLIGTETLVLGAQRADIRPRFHNPRQSDTTFIALFDHLFIVTSDEVVAHHTVPFHIWGITQDGPNNIWLSSDRKGIFIYDLPGFQLQASHFEWVLATSKGPLRDYEGGYWLLAAGRGMLYFRSQDVEVLDNQNGLHAPNSIALHMDTAHNLYIAYPAPVLEIYNMDDRSLTQVSTMLPNGKFRTIHDLYYDARQDQLWATSNYGTTYLQNKKWNENMFPAGRWVDPGQDGRVWCSSYRFFYCIAGDTIYYKSDIKERQIAAQCIYENGTDVWVGAKSKTYRYSHEIGKGVLKLEAEYDLKLTDIIRLQNQRLIAIMDGQVYEYVDDEFQLLLDFYGALKLHPDPDNDSILWFSGNDLYKYNHVNGDFVTYTLYEGLTKEWLRSMVIADSLIITGALDGVYFLQKEKIREFTQPMRTIFDGIWINGKRTPFSSTYELDHNQNDIEFSFRGFNFAGLGDLTYRYMLEGVDSTWVETTRDYMRYPTLPPGTYTFRLQSIRQGKEHLTPVTNEVLLIIHPPWYSTWWFILLLFLGISGLIMLGVRTWISNRLKRQREKAALEQQVLIHELKSLRSQLNPHFIFNSLMAVQNVMLKKSGLEATEYLASFSKLMRQILEHSREEEISIQEELQMIENYLQLQQLRFTNSFTYEIHVAEGLAVHAQLIPPMLLQPVVENAVEHGVSKREHDGRIKISITSNEKHLKIVISDNGPGEPSKKRPGNHRSLSRTITEERIELWNKSHQRQLSMSITNGESTSGTSVTFRLVAP